MLGNKCQSTQVFRIMFTQINDLIWCEYFSKENNWKNKSITWLRMSVVSDISIARQWTIAIKTLISVINNIQARAKLSHNCKRQFVLKWWRYNWIVYKKQLAGWTNTWTLLEWFSIETIMCVAPNYFFDDFYYSISNLCQKPIDILCWDQTNSV